MNPFRVLYTYSSLYVTLLPLICYGSERRYRYSSCYYSPYAYNRGLDPGTSPAALRQGRLARGRELATVTPG